MKKTLFITTGLTVFLSGCSVELVNPQQDEVPSGKHKVTIYASIDEETKTTVDGSAIFSWEDEEQISVLETSSDAVTLFDLDNATTGAFSGTVSDGESLVMAVSPKGAITSALELGGDVLFDITLPTTYNDYIPGTTNAVMIGVPNGTEGLNYKFLFSHAAALLKITYANVPIGTKKLVLSSTNNVLTGVWENIDQTTGVSLSASTATSTGKTVTLTLKNKVVKANQTLTFYVPVPTGTYNDFAIELQDASGTTIAGTSKSKSGLTKSVVAGDVLPLPTVSLPAAVITKGEEYVFSFGGTKKFDNWGDDVLQNDMTWTVNKVDVESGANPGSWDGSSRGQQFGTGSAGSTVTTVSLSAIDYAEYCGSSTAVGINEIHVKGGAKKSTTITCTVSVGGVAMTAKTSGSDSYTPDSAVPGTMTFTSPSLLTGDIEISYTLDTPGALYIHDVTINPDLRTPVTLAFAESAISKTTDNYGSFTGLIATASPNEVAITNNITYSKSDPSTIISSFNTSTGVLALNGTTGTATITARFDGDGTYKPATKSYTITVSTADDVSGTWASWPQTSAWTISTNTVNSTSSGDFCGTSATFEVYNSSNTKQSLTTFGSGSFYGVYFTANTGNYIKISLPVSKAIPVGTKVTVSCYLSANSKVYDSWTVSYGGAAIGAAVTVNHNGSPSSLSDMTQISRTYTTTAAIAKDSTMEFKITVAAGAGTKSGNTRITNILVSAE